MSLTSLLDESKTQGGFYIPRFELRIGGDVLPPAVLRDVTQVTYKDNIKEIDSFELVVNNWDATTRQFKYIGSDKPAPAGEQDKQTAQHKLFEPGSGKVELWMGYADHLSLMVSGRFTTLEPNFPASGPPTINVRGLNVLQTLRNTQYTTAWSNILPSDVALNIATLKDPKRKGAKRFRMPIVVSPKYKSFEKPIEYLAQSNQFDVDFLLSLARQYGYVVYIIEQIEGGKKVQKLYFGRSQDVPPGATPSTSPAASRDVTFRLGWGRTLVEFKPTLSMANQMKSVTVNGWNRKTNKPISVKVGIDDKQLNLNKDLHDLFADRLDPREEVVVDEPVFTEAQARQRAIAILSDRQKDMVKATGTTVGLPDLRAGRKVVIENIGTRFSGTYFITDTTHTLGEGGYTTRFGARRENA